VFVDISFKQINGEFDSVRKGLNAVAELLLAHPPKETDVVAGVHSSGSSSRSLFSQSDGFASGMQSNFHIPLQGPTQANGPFDIIDRQPNMAPFPIGPEAPVHGHASAPIEPLSFRLLCAKDKVGSVIGKGGNTVKTIQNDTGCEIKVLETVPKTDDRIINISGPAVTTFIISCCKIFASDFHLSLFNVFSDLLAAYNGIQLSYTFICETPFHVS